MLIPKGLKTVRRASQLFGILYINLYFLVLFSKQIYMGPCKSICVPFMYCHACPSAVFSCPIGAVQHYAAIRQFPYFVLGHFALVGLLIGRTACGWLCPFGFLQDLMYRVKSRKIEIPRNSLIPFLCLLVLVVLLPFFTAQHWFSKLCPIGTLVAGIPWVSWNPVNPATGVPTIAEGAVGAMFYLKIAILVLLLAFFVVAKRPFCRFLCPLGFFSGFFNKVSIVKIKVGPGCMECDACKDNCPMGLTVREDPSSTDCIRCLECTQCQHVECSVFSSRENPSEAAASTISK